MHKKQKDKNTLPPYNTKEESREGSLHDTGTLCDTHTPMDIDIEMGDTPKVKGANLQHILTSLSRTTTKEAKSLF